MTENGVMIRNETLPKLSDLYESDETAWLEQMAALAAAGELAALDLDHLSEYLSDMARRDKREVLRRLAVLMAHLLKWQHQPDRRSRSWELTIREQQEELHDLLESGSLRNHAELELAKAYQKALRRAVVDTELSEEVFPAECPFSLDQLAGG